jgi:hypothetical protein
MRGYDQQLVKLFVIAADQQELARAFDRFEAVSYPVDRKRNMIQVPRPHAAGLSLALSLEPWVIAVKRAHGNGVNEGEGNAKDHEHHPHEERQGTAPRLDKEADWTGLTLALVHRETRRVVYALVKTDDGHLIVTEGHEDRQPQVFSKDGALWEYYGVAQGLRPHKLTGAVWAFVPQSERR